MGWWKTASGAVIGDGPANVLDEYAGRGVVWPDAAAIPENVRQEIEAMYVEDFGRSPTNEELEVLLLFCE